jgi:hypothetical protein
VTVRPVASAADLRKFIALPYRLHRGDPCWVPTLRMDVRKMLDRQKNPFFAHAEAEYFVAVREPTGAVVGRIAAIHNKAHNAFQGDRAGFFGFFECVDDQPVADALFTAAAAWLAPRGLDPLRGPASFSTNDECGLLVDGFDTPPTLMNPHNPRYYVDLVERAGFQKAKDLIQYRLENPEMPERLVRGVKLLAQRKRIRLRRIDMKQFDAEVERIKRVYNSAWEKNWGFVPMTDEEMDHLAAQLKPVVVPDLVVFAEQGDNVIGFGLALPDFNVALKANPSGRSFPGLLRVMWASRGIRRIRILALGLLKEFRGSGADGLLYHWIWEKGYARGYRWAEAGWILEDNAPMTNGLLRMGFQPYKTLRMYDRPLP